MREKALPRALRQECIWVALNLCGVVWYVIKTWKDTTPSYAIENYPGEFFYSVLPILGTFFLLNLIWTLLVFVAFLRQRSTGYNLLVVLLAGILWTGTFFTVRYRIGCAIEEARQ